MTTPEEANSNSPNITTERQLHQHGAFSVATLRRSSSHVTPTRTLLLSEQEHREATPVRVTHRPRSNQRTRTPRRHESPMDPDVFRRTTTVILNDGNHPEGNNSHANDNDVPRIRLPAGDRGTQTTRPISEVPLSRKQGPSHRKIRRWRNDHFDDLAAEVVSSGEGHRAADALRKAKEKAHLYRDIVNFRDKQCEPLTRFMQDENMRVVRDKFFEGELPLLKATHSQGKMATGSTEKLTAQERLYRIDARLRRVVTKAANNSQPAVMVMKTLETFVRATFSHKKQNRDTPTGQWWMTLLTEEPTVTKRRDGQRTVQFLFDAVSPTGGFHRLLLHAICQYHGLRATCKMVEIEERPSRALMVTGDVIRHKHKLLNQLVDDAGEIDMLEEPWMLTEEPTPDDEWSVV